MPPATEWPINWVAHIPNEVLPPDDNGGCRTAAYELVDSADAFRRPWIASTDTIVLRAITAVDAAAKGLRGKGVTVPAHESAAIAHQEAGRGGPSCAGYDIAFRIRRHEKLSHDQAVLAAAPLFLRMLADLPEASVTADDRVQLLAFAARFIGGYTAGATPSARIQPVSSGPAAFPGRMHPQRAALGPSLDPVRRWLLGHHLYALANRRAAGLIRSATALITVDPPTAAVALSDAAAEVAALTAAMGLAAAMTAMEYGQLVRWTMSPPTVAEELTGAMNLDHRAYRASLTHLLTVVAGRPSNPQVRRGLAQLLNADLYDLERHIELTYRLVGIGPALDQNDHASAVAVLRAMYFERSSRYSALW